MTNSVNARIFRGVIALGWTSLVVKLFALADQSVLSRTYGVGPAMDAINGAWALPNLLTVIFATAVEVILVPVYVRARQLEGGASADRAFSSLVNVCVVFFTVITVLFIGISPNLVHATAPGFVGERFDTAVSLTPIIYPLVLANVLISILTGVLNARDSFTVPNLAKSFLPLMILVAVVTLASRLGIFAMALGQFAGIVLQLALLVYVAHRDGVSYVPTIDMGNEHIRKMAREAPPVLLGSVFINANLFVDQVVAATLPTGQVSALNYALKLIGVPTSVVFGAFAQAAFPRFSEQVARRDWEGLKDSVRLYSWLMLVLTCGMLLGVLTVGRLAVRLIYEGGRFGEADSDAVNAVFIAFAVGLPSMGLGFLIPRALRALNGNYILAALSIFNVVANAALDVILARPLGAAGIALSTSLTLTVALIVQMIILDRMLGGFNPLALPRQVRARVHKLEVKIRGGS